MAETTVAMAPLIREMIEQGAEFVRALEQDGVAILAAFWFLLAEAGQWRLFIATSDIGRIGWQELYGKAHPIRDKLAPEPAFETCNTRRRWRRLVCARGWWGGRARNQWDTNRHSAPARVNLYAGWYDVGILRPNHSIFRTISELVTTGPELAGHRFTNQICNGELVDDVHMYKQTIEPPPRPGPRRRSKAA